MSLSENSMRALSQIREASLGKNSLVFVSGNFNILHPGHLRLLAFAKTCGDFLVVAVHSDSNEGVLFPQTLRVEGLRSLSSVDYVVPLSESIEDFLVELRPHMMIKGKEHEDKFNPEAAILQKFGGKLIFSSGETKFSSVDLLKKDFEFLNFSTIQKPVDFLERHKISNSDLVRSISKMKGLRVVVIGDAIIDEYITCDALGLSQEDPTIVVTPIYDMRFIGGAGIVASHAAGLGADVQYFSVIGKDKNAEFVHERMRENKVRSHLLSDDSRPTTLKQRFRTKDKTLLRVNHLAQHSISKTLIQKMFQVIRAALEETDLLIFSDFNYGCLPQQLVEMVTRECVEKNIKMVADSQSSSQLGDICRFKNMELITPTEREARLGIRDFESGLVVLSEMLRKRTEAKNIFITLGAEGVLVHAHDESLRDGGPDSCFTDRLPSLNTSPRDTAGAGDSMLVCSSLALATGANAWVSVYLGSLAAACQVGRIGNIPLSSTDLLKEIHY